MSVQQFCLRWNNHQPNFISVCSSLLHNGTLVDVTLAAEGRQLQAHKIVLSACSSYFQTLFTTNPCQHPIVILKDVQYDDLKTMVDFMYYGEVNVSQEQLPHILKTAEMLKIKGLAEMPTDPANLTKSDSKSLNEPSDLVGSGTAGQGGGSGSGSSGGLGSSTGGSVSDSLWGSTESQFPQQPQHHHHQQQLQQQQHQQQQQQHHHHQQQQQHHQQQQQQQQNSQTQTQTNQQHIHQLRRTPSPLGAGASPATRRKRLRKSSNNGSGERNNSDDQHNTSLDTGTTAGGITLSQMSQMTFGNNAAATTLGSLTGHSLHAAKLLKESSAADVEPHPQDSDSLEDAHGHVHMQIKPEVDIGMQQTMPLDISGATTPSEHDAPNSQSSHSDVRSAAAVSNYASDAASGRALNMVTTSGNEAKVDASSSSHLQQHQQQQQQMGTKRNRVLTRQPRVKRDSDSMSNNQASPDPPGAALDFDPFGTVVSSTGGSSVHVSYAGSSSHHHLQGHHHQLLVVPPRIERHASEPAPSLGPSSPNLLSVPQSTPYLMKQHSDPLLPTHHAGLAVSGGSNPFAPLHRQYSHPLSGSHSNTGGNSHVSPVPLQISHHISLPECIYASGSPPPAGSSHYLVPQNVQAAATGLSTMATMAATPGSSETSGAASAGGANPITSSTDSGIAMTPTKVSTLPQLTTTYVGGSGDSGGSNSPPCAADVATITTTSTIPIPTPAHNTTPHGKFRSSKSASGILVSERNSSGSSNSLQPGGITMSSSSFEHVPLLRVKNEELQRSVSSPQTSREIITLESPRSSHCPVVRPGPALGCNYCWNTIDGHGRILRRKTKYHCPECQTNLCIVPCFQDYHERINNEVANAAASASNTSSTEGGKHFSSATGSSTRASSGDNSGGGGGGGSGSTNRHYTKTETI